MSKNNQSYGYYINPLISILLGVVVFKEKLGLYRIIAVVLAAVGVGIITASYAKVPWIALILSFSFAIYGLLKKMVKAEAVVCLTIETAVLVIPSLVYIAFRQIQGTGAWDSRSPVILLLLAGSGIVTAVPLLLFAYGAKKVELSMMGFLQYLTPTLMLILGVFVYKEQFSGAHLLSFGLIWIALIIFSISSTKLFNRTPAKETG